MKVFVLAPSEDWICDRLVKEWYSNFGEFSTTNPAEADVIWLMAGWCWNHLHVDLLKSKRVVVTEHHIVPDKFTQEKYHNFMIRDQFVDLYHVPNSKTAEFIRKLTKKPVVEICYWLNDSFWKPLDKNQERARLGISEGDFCIGSFQRDTEGFDLATPKLEKGPDIFCDFIENNYKDVEHIHVILGGWRRQYVQNRLKENRIKHTLFEKADIEKIRSLYAACDLYVVSSRHEGGPQAVIEAAAMRVPILSSDVGIASQVLAKSCLTDFKSFKIPKQEVNYNYDNVQSLAIKKIGKQYLQMLFGEINE